MRALMLFLIASTGMSASPVLLAAAGDDTASAASPTVAENAAARGQAAAPAADSTANPTADAATSSRSSASTDAPLKDPAAAARVPAQPTSASKKEEEEEEFKVPPSYKPRLRDGETVYCRKEGEKGTRFMKTSCYTLAELRYKLEAEKAAADDLTRRARVCGTGSACASN